LIEPVRLILAETSGQGGELLGIGMYPVLMDDPAQNVVPAALPILWLSFGAAPTVRCLAGGGVCRVQAVISYLAVVGFRRMLVLLLRNPCAYA
jgi:hypothetical protein